MKVEKLNKRGRETLGFLNNILVVSRNVKH